MEAHNISKLCEKYPGKYPAPSEVYFGDIETVFSIFRDMEIDMTVMRVEGDIQQEEFDKKQKPKPKPAQEPVYQNPLVRRDNEDDDW